MSVHDAFPGRRQFVVSTMAVLFTMIFSSGVSLIAKAESSAHGGAKTPPAGNRVKAPPLPVGSANVQLQPGMSKKDWHDAYKETGRPKFERSTVKRVGGTVERD